MKELIQDFTSHLEDALRIGKSTVLAAPEKEIRSILICGLGGSGIGGTIISQLLASEARIPIVVNKDYSIPSFVNENTLVVACSYSGNTEETISMLQEASSKTEEICLISSGGQFFEMAKEKNYNFVKIPSGHPPRAAFGLSFPQLYYVLSFYNIIDDSYLLEFNNSIRLINQEENAIQENAKSIAQSLDGKIPVIYSESTFEGVAIRFRQQLNENSKLLAWHAVIPEMNHNELVGWRTKNNNLAAVFIESSKSYYRNKERAAFSEGVVSEYTNTIVKLSAKGNSILEEALYLVHLGDWVSFYLSEIRSVDAVEIAVINKLKGMLSELK